MARVSLFLVFSVLLVVAIGCGRDDSRVAGPASSNMSNETTPVAALDGSQPGFVLVRAGTFTMGSRVTEMGSFANEQPQHQVTISRPFYMAETEITQAQWHAIMGNNPSGHSDCDDCPVENMTWFEAAEFCNALSTLDGLVVAYTINGTTVTWNQSANGYRLPTEAEWEYACRAGTVTAFPCGNLTNMHCSPLDPCLDLVGWYCGNSGTSPGIETVTHPVGTKSPNAWGLYDMHGNVVEWCWDRSGDYSPDAATDPIGPPTGSLRIDRGGAYTFSSQECRSAFRQYTDPFNNDVRRGFRIAKSVDQISVPFDIKPGSCPNPFNPKSNGKLPVAILGTADIDVHDIDVSSLQLEGVAPLRSSMEDVSEPVESGDECDCTDDGPDGYGDLTLKFQTQEIVDALGPVAPGDVKVLTITGALLDGTPFEASDCVVIVGGRKDR